ncbi:hypothetical protein ACFCWD_05635 [Streptomyces sp. NPDC056374]|uniref:hypothetical protein n=1 Tax=unclassified Streptomyces TaxID=2593676 RepID=UPI0035DAAAEB
MKNRFLAGCATLALGATLTLTNASPASASYYMVATQTLTVRLIASTSGPAVGSVPRGQRVTIYLTNLNGGYYTACGKRSNDWAQITDGISAPPLWVSTACLRTF